MPGSGIVYISNSSRRYGEDQKKIESEWLERLGPPTGAVCTECGKKSSDNRLKKGLCWDCREKKRVKIPWVNIVDEGESSGTYQNDY